MAVATQLQIYNDALMLCEERLLASVTEPRKPRYLLDQVWNNGGVNACLEEGLWTFAARTESIVFDPNIQPAFGYIHAFEQPSDYTRTIAIASDPYFNSALTQFRDEGGYWWADLATLYVTYVSTDANYGNNLTLWSEVFKQFVVAHFASKIVKALTHDKEIQDRVEMARKKALESSRGKDGMNEPPGFFPRGQLSRARQGLYFGRPDRSGGGWY
jgi:hypothetical protein